MTVVQRTFTMEQDIQEAIRIRIRGLPTKPGVYLEHILMQLLQIGLPVNLVDLDLDSQLLLPHLEDMFKVERYAFVDGPPSGEVVDSLAKLGGSAIDYPMTQAYAGGLVVRRCVEETGTLDNQVLRDVLAEWSAYRLEALDFEVSLQAICPFAVLVDGSQLNHS